MDLVEQLSGPVAGDDPGRLVQPFGAGGRMDPEAEIAAPAGKIEHELGLVAAVDAEGRVAPVKRAVEELRTVLDHKIRPIGPVAKGAVDVSRQIGIDPQGGDLLGFRGQRRGEKEDGEAAGTEAMTRGHGC